jgi:hypothetical protein
VPVAFAWTVFVLKPTWVPDKDRRNVNNAECLRMILKSDMALGIGQTHWEESFQWLFDGLKILRDASVDKRMGEVQTDYHKFLSTL